MSNVYDVNENENSVNTLRRQDTSRSYLYALYVKQSWPNSPKVAGFFLKPIGCTILKVLRIVTSDICLKEQPRGENEEIIYYIWCCSTFENKIFCSTSSQQVCTFEEENKRKRLSVESIFNVRVGHCFTVTVQAANGTRKNSFKLKVLRLQIYFVLRRDCTEHNHKECEGIFF